VTGLAALQPDTTEDVREVMRDALARRRRLRVRAGGSWLDAGAPVEDAESLSVARLAGVVEYVPGDLTLTARAGTTLEEIRRITAAEQQWLACDPFGDGRGTLGATVATAASGPLAAAFGPPRDMVLGLEVVTGTASVVRGGGRVVKNVAGFDLCRLFTGSWGTLGVITEVTVRLRALPEAEQSLVIPLAAPHAMAAQLASLRAPSLTPLAVQLLSAACSERLGLDARARVLVRLAGNADALRAQRDAVRAMGEAEDVPSTIWRELAEIEPRDASVVRLSRAPALLPEVWEHALAIAGPVAGALVHGCAVRGIVRCVLPCSDLPALEAAHLALTECPDVIVPERLPAAWWPALRMRKMDTPLTRRVRAVFDPHRLLNAGILADSA
jgi:glycolate oxidase FAD binding subunit